MDENWEPATRTELRAFRVFGSVLVTARGDNPHPGYVVDVQPTLITIFPPEFALVRAQLPGNWAQVTPYQYAEFLSYPADQPTIRIHHADGADDVAIEDSTEQTASLTRAVLGSDPKPCPPGADEATGFSSHLRFDDAFADALRRLPEPTETHPDRLLTIQVLETGALFGGFAGFHHLFVRVCRTVT